jgi:8-oxo-dGTP pyrophosphatase MutT (NUDIX family)
MNEELADFLTDLEPLVRETAVWGNGRFPLEITYYLSSKLPPLAYVSSVRAVVFRERELLTLLDPNGEYYIVPGGRWEKGESVEEALCRELLEETGWTLCDAALLSVTHFHHLAPKPDDYPYPYPDFLQLVYVATAEQFIPEAIEFDQYVVESRFWGVQEIQPLLKNQAQLALLDAALAHFAGML